METLSLILIGVGGVIAAVGGIWLLVAAFTQSIWWGLASLFIPFANLLFVILHWAKARTAFCLNLLGACIAIGGLFISPALRQAVTASMATISSGAIGVEQKPTVSLDERIQAKRDEIDLLEVQFRADSVALTQQFQALQARREALKPGDNEAIAAFNAEAAAYQQKNAALKELRAKVDAAQLELTALLDERSRAAKKVVMYTTARCGACKAAKQYLAQKGVTYEERDVERSSTARSEFDRLGGRGVPLILIGNERMEGFDSRRLDQLL